MNNCQHYDNEFNCCKVLSDWSNPMPVLQPCVESPCEKYSPITNFDRIKNMSIEKIAENAVYELRTIAIVGYMSLIDATCYSTKELAIKHNKIWLESEVSE